MQRVAVTIGQDLNFDVTRAADVALEKHGVVAEGRTSLLAGFLDFRNQFLGVFDDAHAASAAAERGFDDQREADAIRRGACGVKIGDGMAGSGNHWNSGGGREVSSRGLIAQEFENFRAGTDEGDAGVIARAGQRGIFGEETVAGMNRVDVILPREVDRAVDIEVRLDRSFA